MLDVSKHNKPNERLDGNSSGYVSLDVKVVVRVLSQGTLVRKVAGQVGKEIGNID